MRAKTLEVRRLGFVEYEDGLRVMEAYRQARQEQRVADTLFLLQHLPVLTLGRKGRPADVLAEPSELQRKGIQIFETDRGGEGTYHGPGQIVGYPIVDLSPDRRDVRRYVRDLEETMLRAALESGVQAGRVAGLNGIWLAPDADPPSAGPSRKLGALGVHLSRWITSHGFALNVNTDLAAFSLIVACGIRDRGVTSLAEELGRPVSIPPVEDSLVRHFSDLFDREAVDLPIEHATVQVQVVRRGSGASSSWRCGASPNEVVSGSPSPGGSSPASLPPRRRKGSCRRRPGSCAAESNRCATATLSHGRGPGPRRLAEESAFVVEAPADFHPALSAREHDASEWVSPAEAAVRFPFAGLRRGAALAAAWAVP